MVARSDVPDVHTLGEILLPWDLLVMSNTTIATDESRMYDGMSERKRSWPAVSHSCKRTVRSSRYMVLLKKSIPIVAW